ncbi:hypothetical protein C8R43DRAFT_1135837 [Mycena crocata]|nr:hypothetical protein C8R43DRAFT_1135837 [Mycena crocata]
MSDWGSTTSSERNQLQPSEVQGWQADNCTLEADVLLRSSDGVLYAAHSKNLELYSDGFPPASFAGADEIRQPDSSNFELLAGLAEAAEKYMVYSESAMEVCKIQMW